jgi:hypothetical protein
LVNHIKSYPPHTAPAGYACPDCSTSIWPPKSVKDSGSRLHSKLKEAIMQTGLEKNLFGNHPVSMAAEPRGPPPAFASDPLMNLPANSNSSVTKVSVGSPQSSTLDILEIDGPSSTNHEPNFMNSTSPGATTRKTAMQERQNSEISYYADDEDANRKKYTRRGGLRHKFLRSLIPFWSSALPILPVTAPSRKDSLNAEDVEGGRARHHRSSRADPRKILLIIAIMACMATMGILYYRLAQNGLGEEVTMAAVTEQVQE